MLEKNIDVLCKTKERETALHVLLGQIKHDIPKTCELCRELIKRGVDINAKDKKGQMAIQYITRIPKLDKELRELYDIWFAEPNLDLTSADFMGRTPLEFAEGLPEREELFERMKKYDRR